MRSLSGLKAYVMLTHPVAVLVWSTATVLFASIVARGHPGHIVLAEMVAVVAGTQACIGCFNEVTDREVDAKVKPWRPIPSGAVSVRSARLIGLVLLVLSLAASTLLGYLGLAGASVALCVGLSYNAWIKGTALSWLPAVVGYSMHPVWIWLLTGHPLIRQVLILPIFVYPLIVGLHLANQLPDLAERQLGVCGLAHRMGPLWAPRIMTACLLAAPIFLLIPLQSEATHLSNGVFAASMVAYYILLGVALGRSWCSPGYRSRKLAFILIEIGTLALISGWLAALTSSVLPC